MRISSGWTKLVAGGAGRKTRFHTLRGALLSAGAWLDVPSALVTRGTGRHPVVPWIAPRATAYLAVALTPGVRLIEFGAGYSTLWFAERTAHVHALESNPTWYERLGQLLNERGVTNVRLELVPISRFVEHAAAHEADAFDVAMVDHVEGGGADRLTTLARARDIVAPGGLVVLDNSDRPAYRNADTIMAGWQIHRFDGFLARPLQATETTVFRRPDSGHR